MHEVTFVIHTFKRPTQLNFLKKSIKKYYPDVKVLVYDDSEYDRGLSWGRNYLVSQVDTKYFLLLDDDFVFTPNTCIEKLKTRILRGFDIVAGSIVENGVKRHYEGKYELSEGVLRYIPRTTPPLDFVFNFFLGRTETFKKYKWDDRLKLAEHTAFFLDHKGKLKIDYLPEVEIEHRPFKDKEYLEYRNRALDYFDKYMARKGIKKVINFEGTVYEGQQIRKNNRG